MEEQLKDYTSQLLRNDMDATKHSCLYYLAGTIGTGAELEDFFYLMCKTLDYDKNKVLFYYSTYMTVTGGTLFSGSPLTDERYEDWIRERRHRCSSVRTSTCENLCRRKAYLGYDIPSHACCMCKLSPSYKNSRDPLERMVIRYFMDPGTPSARIYVNGSEDGFVSVERISPRANSFGRYPVIRFYNYVYDYLFNESGASDLRSDRNKFNEAAAGYISSRLDLSSFDSNLVDRDIIYARLVSLLGLLWDTDIAPMKSDDDGSRFADMCIRLMHQPYEPVYEGKQVNPRSVSDNGGGKGTRRSRKKRLSSDAFSGMDLVQMAEAAVAAQKSVVSEHAGAADLDGISADITSGDKSACASVPGVQVDVSEAQTGNNETCQFVAETDPGNRNGVDNLQHDDDDMFGLASQDAQTGHVCDPAADSDAYQLSDDAICAMPALLDRSDFRDSDYVPFDYGATLTSLSNPDCDQSAPEEDVVSLTADRVDAGMVLEQSGDTDGGTGHSDARQTPTETVTEESALLPFLFAPAWRYPYAYGQLCGDTSSCGAHHSQRDTLLTLSSGIDYLGHLVHGVAAAYQYCVRVPYPVAVPASSWYPVRITDETAWDFLHECATSDYALLLPAVSGVNEEGLLLFLSSRMRYYFFNLSVRGADNLDCILINSRTVLYTSDTLGCMSMLVKYGSRIASSPLIGMDLFFQLSGNALCREEVYAMDCFKAADVLSLPLCMYKTYIDQFGGSGASAGCHYEVSRLMCAYRMLFHQRYLPPLLSDGAPLFAFTDDLHIRFLFDAGYRFTRRGTLYTIRFGPDVTIGGDLTGDSILCDLLGLFDLMTHRYFHASRIVYCDQSCISVFLESLGTDAGIFYDMFYHGVEAVLLDHGHAVAETVTIRTEYR